MVRPRKCRFVCHEPGITYFKPRGIPINRLEEIELTVDELEAVRLKDLEELEQEEAANLMGISQPTFHRLLNTARKKISEAIIKGKALKIHGGEYKLVRRVRYRFCRGGEE
jgi:predicted DNA-binding protein (UPF0251 family)